MKLLGKILIFALFFFNIIEKNSAEETTTAPLEPAYKKELFHRALNKTLLTSPEYQKYSNRVECMMRKIMKNENNENVFELVEKSFYKIDKNNIVFVNESEIMSQLEKVLKDANFSCSIFGYVAIVGILLIMVILVGCVICLKSKDY